MTGFKPQTSGIGGTALPTEPHHCPSTALFAKWSIKEGHKMCNFS